MDINNLITRLHDIAWDFPKEHPINQAADMLTVLADENNELQHKLKSQEVKIARLNEAREIANEKAREYEKQAELVEDQKAIINIVRRDKHDIKARYEELSTELKQVKKERDAAVTDLVNIMNVGSGNIDTCQFCRSGQCYARHGTKLCNPEWRGLEE